MIKDKSIEEAITKVYVKLRKLDSKSFMEALEKYHYSNIFEMLEDIQRYETYKIDQNQTNQLS